MPTYTIGLNAYHGDAAAAIFRDGDLVAAVEEERFNRIKHWAGFPAESVRFCLDAAGITGAEVDHVAVSSDPGANLGRRLAFVAKNRPSPRAVVDRLRRRGRTLGIGEAFAAAAGCSPNDLGARIHRVEHHDAHIGAGFLLSPFPEAAVLSVDGMGDFVSTVTAHGRGTGWETLDRVFFPHSLGFLYNAITLFLGFPHYGDEYKVMGLAPYGEPEFLDEFRKLVLPSGDTFVLELDYFTHHRNGIAMRWDGGAPTVAPFHSPQLTRLLGPARRPDEPVTPHHENIARSLQEVTEEVLAHVLRRLHARTGCPDLCLTGGVAMNSVANGKVLRDTPFENLWVPAGAADNGTSFGAAAYVWHHVLGHPRETPQTHAYLGDTWDDAACAAACAAEGETCTTEADDDALNDRITDAIIAGKVVGWFRGPMEFGARALGNRSLIADPRRTDMRDIINLKIKFREKFRPFAPSILDGHVTDWFEADEPSPYMERVLPILEHRRPEIPAVTHVDGSGRLQTVSAQTNPAYHALIDRFREKTGVPILLNTSLNENKPIVRTPAEAVRCYQRTAMDILVLGRNVIERQSS